MLRARTSIVMKSSSATVASKTLTERLQWGTRSQEAHADLTGQLVIRSEAVLPRRHARERSLEAFPIARLQAHLVVDPLLQIVVPRSVGGDLGDRGPIFS